MSVFPYQLPSSKNILIAGAGGGFDFLCGLPIALELEAQNHNVHIANYSFTNLHNVQNANWATKNLLEINADSFLESDEYFPELHLSKWYREKRQHEVPIWCLSKEGVQPTLESYSFLIERFKIDVVICVDGGVDGIFRGDECDLGTPSMDSISVIATSLCNVKTKIYACTAFGTEGAEGKVSHAQALNRIADLIKLDAFLGVGSIHKNNEAGNDFIEAVNFIFERMNALHRSTIISTILAALDGTYGRKSVNAKTQINPPWISPLTLLFWYFDAKAVAEMKLFYEQAKNSVTVQEVAQAIQEARDKNLIMPFEQIPI